MYAIYVNIYTYYSSNSILSYNGYEILYNTIIPGVVMCKVGHVIFKSLTEIESIEFCSL